MEEIINVLILTVFNTFWMGFIIWEPRQRAKEWMAARTDRELQWIWRM